MSAAYVATDDLGDSPVRHTTRHAHIRTDASASMGIPTGLTGMHRRSQLLSLTNFSAFYTYIHPIPASPPLVRIQLTRRRR
jgi:hypothetical protein